MTVGEEIPGIAKDHPEIWTEMQYFHDLIMKHVKEQHKALSSISSMESYEEDVTNKRNTIRFTGAN